jgi:hypothetical protein
MKTSISITTTVTILLGLSVFSPSMAASGSSVELEVFSASQTQVAQRLIPVVESTQYPKCKNKCQATGSQGAGTR